MVCREPTCVRDLRWIDADVSMGVFGREPNHERIGEGPRLTAEVTDVFHRDAHLFEDLHLDACFERLTGLHKTGKDAVELGREPLGVGQKGFDDP